MRYPALFILGIMVGAVITMLAVGRQLDQAHLERRALQNRVIELNETIDRLEKAMDEQRQAVRVQSVKVSLMDPPDPFASLDIEEACRGLLADLIGKEVSALDLRLVHNLLEDRIVEVSTRRYRLNVVGIQIHRQTEVLVRPVQIAGNGGEDEP